MVNKDISWRVAMAIVLGAIILIAGGTLALSFAPNTHSSDRENFWVRLITTPIVIVGTPLGVYFLVLEGRANAANRPANLPPPRLIFGMPPKVRQLMIIHLIVAIICGTLDYGFLSGQFRHRDTPGFDRFFTYAFSYWFLASVASIVLIWRRSRLGWMLSWTIFPGIIRTIPCLISVEMTDYLASRYAGPFSVNSAAAEVEGDPDKK